MNSFIKLYSNKDCEIERFLNDFFLSKDFENLQDKTLEYKIEYQNPVEMSDIISAFIDNKDNYKITMWMSIDKDVLINITDNNANEIIKYLFERFPY